MYSKSLLRFHSSNFILVWWVVDKQEWPFQHKFLLVFCCLHFRKTQVTKTEMYILWQSLHQEFWSAATYQEVVLSFQNRTEAVSIWTGQGLDWIFWATIGAILTCWQELWKIKPSLCLVSVIPQMLNTGLCMVYVWNLILVLIAEQPGLPAPQGITKFCAYY